MGGDEAKLSGPDLEAGIPEGELGRERLAPRTCPRRAGAARAAGRRAARPRRDLHPLRRAPRGGADRRRDRPLPLASRLLRPADRAPRCARPRSTPSPATTWTSADGRIRVGARRGGPVTIRRPSALRTIAIVGAGRGGRVRGRDVAAGGLRRRDPPLRRGRRRRRSIGPTCRRTTWRETRPRTGSRCARRRSSASKRSRWRWGRASPRIDPAARKLSLADGREVAWDALLLATGAEPVRLAIPGGDLQHVHTLRTLGDCRAIIERATRARRAVWSAPASSAWRSPPRCARAAWTSTWWRPRRCRSRARSVPSWAVLRAVHEERGVHFHLGQTVSAVEPDAVTLSGGDRAWPPTWSSWASASAVVRARQGRRPGVDRGVVVDDRLRTERRGRLRRRRRRPLSLRADGRAGPHRALGRRAADGAGRGAQHAGRRPAVHLATVLLDDAVRRHAEVRRPRGELGPDRRGRRSGGARRDAAYRRGGQTLAVATIGRDRVSLDAELAMEAGDEVTLAAFGRTR